MDEAIEFRMRTGQPVHVIVDEGKHRFATGRLRSALRSQRVHVHPYAALRTRLEGPAFLLADPSDLDDQSLRDLGLAQARELGSGGYVARSGAVAGDERAPVTTLVGADMTGVIYAVQQLADDWLADEPHTVAMRRFDVRRGPALPYRMFWTWDHSTNWYLEQLGLQEVGACNDYTKPAAGFLADYTRLIDFMVQHRLNGVVIYGFLRDKHGGIEAAKEVARYGRERGVRVIPGVGINSYGGVYWDGEHPYNLGVWLSGHPELRAHLERELPFPVSHFGEVACPSKSENAAYHREAIAWLCDEFEIGGINFETGDYGICQCRECRQRRRRDDGAWSIADAAELYPSLFAAAKSSNPDIWLIAEAYFDNVLDLAAIAPLGALPPETVCQYCINRPYWPRVRSGLDSGHVARLPLRTNVLRTHMGSQWNQERYELVARDFADLARVASTAGMQGVNVFGEVSAFHCANEINFLAYATFAYDGAITWEQFVVRVLAPRLGGEEAARAYLELLATPPDDGSLRQAIGRCREIAAPLTDDGHCRRWVWLANRLYQKRAML